MMWVIAVTYETVEERTTRYFNGRTEPGFVGEATIFLDDAMIYSTKEAAERDIAKLSPRSFGAWTAVEHPL